MTAPMIMPVSITCAVDGVPYYPTPGGDENTVQMGTTPVVWTATLDDPDDPHVTLSVGTAYLSTQTVPLPSKNDCLVTTNDPAQAARVVPQEQADGSYVLLLDGTTDQVLTMDTQGYVVTFETLTPANAYPYFQHFEYAGFFPEPAPTMESLVALPTAFFDTGDTAKIGTPGGAYLAYNNTGTFLADATQEAATLLSFEVEGDAIYLTTPQGAYLTTRNGNLVLQSGQAGATSFVFYATADGTGAAIGTADGRYLTVGESTYVAVGALSAYTPAMEFALNMTAVPMETLLARHGISLDDVSELTPCQIATAGLVWQASGGLFLAIGLGFAIQADAPAIQSGLVALLRSSAPVAAALDALWQGVVANPEATAALVFGFLTALYQQHLLWLLVKMLLTAAGWWAVATALVKVITLVVAPEVYAVEMIAGFAVWAAQIVISATNVSTACA